MLLVEITDLDPDRMGEIVELMEECSDEPWPEEAIREDLLERDELLYAGALWRGRLVGLAVLELEGLVGKVLFVGVRGDYRRRGIGSQLVLACAEVARARGCLSLVCRSRDEEGLRAFYSLLGFKVVEREEGRLRWAKDLSGG